MIQYFEGTVFNAPAKTIVNTVNCLGVMGAGLAQEFKLRYPEMYSDYVKRCKIYMVRIGEPYLYKFSDQLWILNFPTKFDWKRPSKLGFIEEGLEKILKICNDYGIESIAFPKLGTNKGGLKWDQVKMLMEKHLSKLEVDIYICLDNLPKADGDELKMLNIFNGLDVKSMAGSFKISKSKVDILTKSRPIERFGEINLIEGVGSISYEKIFKFCYDNRENDVDSMNIYIQQEMMIQ